MIKAISVEVTGNKWSLTDKQREQGYKPAFPYEDNGKVKWIFATGLHHSNPNLSLGHAGGQSVEVRGMYYMLPVLPDWLKSPEVFAKKANEFIANINKEQ